MGGKDEKIVQLQNEVALLQNKVQSLEERIEETENSNRCNDIILSGSAVLSSSTEMEDTRSAVRNLLRTRVNLELPSDKILSTSRLGKLNADQGPDKRRIIVRLPDRGTKEDILRAFRTSKPSEFYANENLTPGRSKVLFALRRAKRRFPQLISGCGSRDGRVYAWISTPSSTGRNNKIFINSWNKLESVCEEFLGVQVDDLGVEKTDR